MSETKPSNQEDELTLLGRELGLDLPPGSRIVGVERSRGGEAMVRTKLLMTSAEWTRFNVASPVKPEAMDPGTGGFLGQDHAWWDPHGAIRLRTGQVQREPGTFLNIGFDDSNPEAVAVYVVKHGT